MKACPHHKHAAPAETKESAAIAAEFRRKHGAYPIPCPKCNYLVLDPEVYKRVKLLELKGSIRGTELESLLVGE